MQPFVVFPCPVVTHWCLYDSPKEFISLFTFMQDSGRTTFQEGFFIGGNRFLRVGFFLPFQPVDLILLAYWTAIWPCPGPAVAVVLQDLMKSL